MDDQLGQLARVARGSVNDVRTGLAAVQQARADDYAYARGLMHLPSLDAPGLAPALFGSAVLAQVEPILYWLRAAEKFMPPGVRHRLQAANRRARRDGTDVTFPKDRDIPSFLLGLAELSVELGGSGAAAGQYAVRVANLSSAPTLLSVPATFFAERVGGIAGPETLRLGGMIDHRRHPIHDSLAAFVGGVNLPTLGLDAIGARLNMGEGTTLLALSRLGDAVDIRLTWETVNALWDRCRRKMRRCLQRSYHVHCRRWRSYHC